MQLVDGMMDLEIICRLFLTYLSKPGEGGEKHLPKVLCKWFAAKIKSTQALQAWLVRIRAISSCFWGTSVIQIPSSNTIYVNLLENIFGREDRKEKHIYSSKITLVAN